MTPHECAVRCLEFARWKRHAFAALAPETSQAHNYERPVKVTKQDQCVVAMQRQEFLDRCAQEVRLESAKTPSTAGLRHNTPGARSFEAFLATHERFTRRDMHDAGLSEVCARYHLRQAIAAGLVKEVQPKYGAKHPAVYEVTHA